VPTKTLADLDRMLAQDHEYLDALKKLARRESIARKLIRFRLENWRRISRPQITNEQHGR
jgi:hypothetical protein